MKRKIKSDTEASLDGKMFSLFSRMTSVRVDLQSDSTGNSWWTLQLCYLRCKLAGLKMSEVWPLSRGNSLTTSMWIHLEESSSAKLSPEEFGSLGSVQFCINVEGFVFHWGNSHRKHMQWYSCKEAWRRNSMLVKSWCYLMSVWEKNVGTKKSKRVSQLWLS